MSLRLAHQPDFSAIDRPDISLPRGLSLQPLYHFISSFVVKMAPAAVSPAVTGRSQKDPRPIPAVPDINSESYTSEDALVEDIIAGLKRAGFCIIRQIIKPDVRAKISAEFRPYTTNLAPTPGDFWPKETRKILSMVSKSETYALEMVGHPVWQRVGEHFMTSTLKDYWVCYSASSSRISLLNIDVLLLELRRDHDCHLEATIEQHSRIHHWAWCSRSRPPPR